jgi:transcriptional regulator with XRE-family HTH domain
MSVSSLADRSGLSRTTIDKIEHGTSPFKTNNAVAQDLAEALNCRVSDLFDSIELSPRGRPPHTGKPTAHQTGSHPAMMLCINCWIVVPADIGCDACERSSVLVPA